MAPFFCIRICVLQNTQDTVSVKTWNRRHPYRKPYAEIPHPPYIPFGEMIVSLAVGGPGRTLLQPIPFKSGRLLVPLTAHARAGIIHARVIHARITHARIGSGGRRLTAEFLSSRSRVRIDLF